MPRTFFDQVIVDTPRQRSRPWVTGVSVIAHVIVLALFFILPLTAAITLPPVHDRLPVLMLVTTAPMPAELVPAMPATTVAVSTLDPDAAPVEAPDRVTDEVPRPPSPGALAVPGGIPGVGTPGGFTGLLGAGRSGSPLRTPPPPIEQAPVRVGGEIEAPTRVTYRAPIYPQVAIAARLEGTVLLEATIDATGVVRNVTVLRSVPMLDRAAIEAVQQWRYTPTRLNGQAVPVIMTVTVTFGLR
ncbi:MAG: TonB family protein [Acidobacteria bacterium]|nr:TonB family protein [Acidobacteriota bacterium]